MFQSAAFNRNFKLTVHTILRNEPLRENEKNQRKTKTFCIRKRKTLRRKLTTYLKTVEAPVKTLNEKHTDFAWWKNLISALCSQLRKSFACWKIYTYNSPLRTGWSFLFYFLLSFLLFLLLFFLF